MKPQPITTAYDLTTGRGRLRYLADEVLARVTREGSPFNLNSWVERDVAPHDCGTAACAVGWGARDVLLSAEGLLLETGIDDFGQTISPVFGQLSNWPAIQAFFDISEDQAHNFFMTFGYRNHLQSYVVGPTAADVAARIRAHLAETEGV